MANDEKWVNDRLNVLAPPPGWQPDSIRAFAQVHEFDRVHRRRTRWAWTGMAASLFALALFLTPARCALGVCRNTGPAPVEQPAPDPQPAPSASYKESVSPAAQVTIEVFTDYQCPHCATIYDQIIPMLRADYVQTGKVKLIHRDYPLPMHPKARLAARYANAAGTLGQYEIAVAQIFRTQAAWSQSGDVQTQLAQVLPPDVMDRIRTAIQSDAHLDDTIASDVAVAHLDNLNQTPSLVVAHNGIRQVFAPVPPYALLKSYLDDLLAK